MFIGKEGALIKRCFNIWIQSVSTICKNWDGSGKADCLFDWVLRVLWHEKAWLLTNWRRWRFEELLIGVEGEEVLLPCREDLSHPCNHPWDWLLTQYFTKSQQLLYNQAMIFSLAGFVQSPTMSAQQVRLIWYTGTTVFLKFTMIIILIIVLLSFHSSRSQVREQKDVLIRMIRELGGSVIEKDEWDPRCFDNFGHCYFVGDVVIFWFLLFFGKDNIVNLIHQGNPCSSSCWRKKRKYERKGDFFLLKYQQMKLCIKTLDNVWKNQTKRWWQLLPVVGGS